LSEVDVGDVDRKVAVGGSVGERRVEQAVRCAAVRGDGVAGESFMRQPRLQANDLGCWLGPGGRRQRGGDGVGLAVTWAETNGGQ